VVLLSRATQPERCRLRSTLPAESIDRFAAQLSYCQLENLRAHNHEGYTLADLIKDLAGGFLLAGDQDEPSPDVDPTPYPGSVDETTQAGPCLCIE
jgi:hypothetical protein